MSSFKDKPLKKCHTDKRRMIDDLHKILIQDELTDKNEYYLDTCIEVALKLNLKVTFMKIDKYISWGTPVELKNNYYK